MIEEEESITWNLQIRVKDREESSQVYTLVRSQLWVLNSGYLKGMEIEIRTRTLEGSKLKDNTNEKSNNNNSTILEQLPFFPDEKHLIKSAEKRLIKFILSVAEMATATIDREIAEEKNDLDFIVQQVKADPKSYSSDDCRRISHDILIRQVRIAILKSEIDRRSVSSREFLN